MDKLKMNSADITKLNIEKIAMLFPNVITEDYNINGELEKKIDFDKLKAELTNDISNADEYYDFTWVGKKESIVNANKSLKKTLRPIVNRSINWDTTENLYIEGDNAEALSVLQNSYLGKIKLIYIDPPYNTGNDILYKNNYFESEAEYNEKNTEYSEDGKILFINTDSNARYHSDWLSMMNTRLRLSRNLLTDDGCVVIAIDENELFNLGALCDEIFGCENRIGVVTVVHKPEGRNQAKYFATSNEFALFYAKNKNNFLLNSVVLDDEILKTFNREDEKGKYRLNNYIRLGGGDANLKINKPTFYYPIYISPDLKDITLEKKDGYIEKFPETATQARTWKTKASTFKECLDAGEIIAEKDSNGVVQVYEKYRIEKGQLIKTHWIDKRYNAISNGTKVLENLMGTKTFDFPKSLYLMMDTLKLTTNKDSIILDFFSGSATTAHAVMQLNAEDGGNRKFIMVQIPQPCDEKSEAYKAGYKTICEIGEERIRRAGKKIQEENPDKKIDTGFRVFKVDETNMKEIYYSPKEYSQNLLDSLESNIKEDRTDEDLLYGCLLDWGVELSLPHKVIIIDGKKIHIVNDNDLVACFEDRISEFAVREIAKKHPSRVVFRDSSFSSDDNKINVDEIFKLLAPNTTVKVV